MARFEAIEEDGPHKVTFAMVREDGSLVIQARYFGNDGYAGHEEVSLLPMGVKKLLELLSVTQPNKSLKSDGSALKLLRRIREKVLTDLDYDADEIVREIDAVLADAEAAA